MPPELIQLKAGNIDGAAQQIIRLLEDTDEGGDVIYLYGWDGWGASAVLKEVVKRLQSSLGSGDTGIAGGLEKIIHVDFSLWQSKRALQKAIAEELELPQQVMALFDQHDEEDDFDGVEQSARGVIPHVKLAIRNELSACRFLVVLHNGSGSYMELREVGVPLIGELGKRVLWTASGGRFWPHGTARHGTELKDVVEESAGLSDVAICFDLSSSVDRKEDDIKNILYAEIAEIARYTGVPEPDMSLNIVTECILYMVARGNDQDISWKSHASNYWVCDGIIHDAADGGRSAWEISDALQRNMNLDLCNKCAERIYELWGGEQQRHIDRWVSATSQNLNKVPPQATSFFWIAGGPSSSTGHNETSILEAGIFEHSSRASSLRVIHLSNCTFSFSSPPFLSCSNLRFLLLDRCKDQDAQDLGEEKESHYHSHCSQQDDAACFQNLWVLELSYTDWYWLLSKDMLDLMVDLRELNVKGVSNRSMMHLRRCSGAGRNNRRLVKLRVVADPSKDDGYGVNGGRNEQVSSFPDLSSWHILKTVVLDGCGDLELIDHNALPQQSLESFTLISSSTNNKIKRISFRGCAKLNSLLLRGFFDSLVELDMSGTSIKTLDLSATQAMFLRRLFLLGCEKLCAILWPQETMIWLEILRIDTTYAALLDRGEGKSNKQQEGTTASDSASISIGSSSSAMVCGKDRTITDWDSYISVRDPRLFRSLAYTGILITTRWLHVEISSTGPGHKGTCQGISNTSGCGSAAVNAHKPGGTLYADDIIIISTSDDDDDDATTTRDVVKASLVMRRSKWLWLWGCPPIPEHSDWPHCYISIQDEAQTTELLLQGGTATSTQQLINRGTTTVPPLVSKDAKTLHVHDSLSITCLPGPAPAAVEHLAWNELIWCRLERCPNLEGVVFTTAQSGESSIFWNLETFWASQLPKARYIWDWSTTSPPFRPGFGSFGHLVFLHLDYCPRLVHVLPLFTSNPNGCRNLETLEIVCCGDLREVFPSYDSESEQQQVADEPRRLFPRLKRIHLYELPKLQRICGRRMLAPNLETVKVRGCWSLRRLPAIGIRAEAESSSEEATVDIDCEKEWWDNLEWDGSHYKLEWREWDNDNHEWVKVEVEAGHHPSHYKPTYSAYYKKKQLRASVLR